MEEELTEQQAEETKEFDFKVLFGDIWRGFVKFWWVGIILAVLFAGIQFYRQHVRYTPVYESTATFTVHMENSVLSQENGGSAYSFYYDVSMADQLATVFPYVVSNDILRSRVCSELGVPAVPAAISVTSVPGTNMITLTTSGTDPELTYRTLHSVIDNYSSVADYIIGRSRLVMITEPELPTEPGNALDWQKAVLHGVLLGLLLGLGWIVLYALLRKTIRTREDIRTELNQHCLGVVPQVTFKKYRSKIDTSILLSNPLAGRDFLEALRLLRSAVQNRLGPEEKVLMVTSTAPGEGKSVTTVNLAAMFAKNESRVLVIDCDLRNSGILPLLQEKEQAGEARETEKTESYSIHALKGLDISLLTFRTDGGRAREILRASVLQELTAELRDRYDYIFIDTPPCGMISDASIVADAADAVVYIVRQDTVMRDSIRSGLNLLLSADEKVLGCVLTGATGGLGGYGSSYSYRGYHKYYRYGYGYHYGHYGEYGTHEKSGKSRH